jgi:hypothetical protein
MEERAAGQFGFAEYNGLKELWLGAKIIQFGSEFSQRIIPNAIVQFLANGANVVFVHNS